MLSNDEIEKLADKHGIKLDYCGYKDTMPDISNISNFNAIINLDGSSPDDFNSNGSHWVALVIKDKYCIYFDPFGLPEAIETIKFINKQKPIHYGYSQIKIQDIKDDHCGWYCLGYLIYVNKHSGNLYNTTNNFINLFNKTDSKKNLSILYKLI